MQLFPSQPVPELNIEVVYAKKEYNYLRSLESNLKSAVDFGVWGFFAEIILRGLQFFYGVVSNWGLAIILLTFVVRLITFPLQYKSFVSMKKMQVVQPELTKLREKYKDDPMRMQKESMDLFKRAGANPLGGCLPLLLQLPVFFAFFKVLNSAVELVDAPFYGWIHDLSNKDPYYVLPLIVTGAMFMQQKLTPQTITDPVQKKIFMFMPLIFGFIMKDQASGLSLYIFVSTVLGIGQQMLVFHMIKDKPVVV
jgi:YidC/Oxa1 family membrane protein insertase